MVMFGLDISHHQDLALDLARCKREDIDFIFLKATEGNSFVDDEFAANLAEARRAGLLVAAYHYVRGNVSAAAQVAHIAKYVPKSVPVIPDTEDGGGELPLTRELITKMRAAGYRVPLMYLPKWYWQQIGSPSMAGLPPLWASRYPDMVQGSIQDEWADVPASYWTGYGGLSVSVLQFTSSAAVAGHAPLDANAFRGTAAQLAALFGGTVEEDDMQPTDAVKDPGPDRWGHTWLNTNQTLNNSSFGLAALGRRIDAATAAVSALAQLIAKGTNDLTAEQVEAAVAKALRENTVEVDVHVSGGSAA